VKALAAALLLGAAGPIAAQVPDPAVSGLLRAVATSGCQMERNGELHDAEAAAEHLRMKLERSGRPSMNADQFIDRVASGSTVTGRPYRVLCPGRPPVDSRAWLRARLAEQSAPR
jgi:hypothetical protein